MSARSGFGEAGVLLEVGLVVVNAQQHAHPPARIGLLHAEKLVPVVEALAAKGLVHGMRRVVELDENVLIARAVIRPPRAEHQTELGPIFDRARPLGEGH